MENKSIRWLEHVERDMKIRKFYERMVRKLHEKSPGGDTEG